MLERASRGTNTPADAMADVDAFVGALLDPTSVSAIQETDVISLVGMCLLRTGWTQDLKALETPCLVVKLGVRRGGV